MTPAQATKQSNGSWKRINGKHPKMNVYNQRDQHQLIVDPNFCVGASVANIYQAMTGKVGKFARSLYEAGKRRQREGTNPENAEIPGIPIHAVCAVATEMYGGEYHRIRTVPDILAWLDVVGPVAIGFIWSEGMEYPTGRGWWWKRWFGPQWMTPTHKTGVNSAHCVTILGGSYHDGGFVWIENSVGLSWGNKGVARMSWEHLAAMVDSGKGFAYGIDFPKDPKLVA